MAGDWIAVNLSAPLFLNADEAELTGSQMAALENCFQVETGAIERFPGLTFRAQQSDMGRVYLHAKPYLGDLLSVSSTGRVHRIDGNGLLPQAVTGRPVTGGSRPSFAETPDDGVMMAAGGEIIQFDGTTTKLLSRDAPTRVSHVQYINGFLVANDGGTFRYCELGDYGNWPALDVFAADSKPDLVNALMVTPFSELLVCGVDSIEQYEATVTGDTPFFRRFTAAEGLSEPGCLVFLDNATLFLNVQGELTRLTQQVGQEISAPIDRALGAWDRSGAWAGGFVNFPLSVLGQKFALFQFPNAVSPYGAKGMTLLMDLRTKRFTTLFGWDQAAGRPNRWPAWSYANLGNRTILGMDGGQIWELDTTRYTQGGDAPMRMLVRTGYLSQGEVSLDGVRLTCKRGVGTYTSNPTLQLRCRRDGGPWSNWVSKGLGLAGQNGRHLEFGGFGSGQDFQFEIQCSDNAKVELLKLEVQPSRIGF